MKFLWILESGGIHCLIVLLLSVFLLAARGTNASTSTVLPFSRSTWNLSVTTEKTHVPKTSPSFPSISSGTREESATATIKTPIPGLSDINITSPGNHSRITATPPLAFLTTNSTHSLSSSGPSTTVINTTAANITIPGTTTTQDPGRRPLTFWAIILICLTVSGLFIGGYIGCCFLWKNTIF
ncbi:mucin-2-like [Erythrolamprus reginae]|uniref:mucin-2-like n=1 Tax=Erythrolamprus reginae TaxID=121349 RepID=UPI00396CC971